MNNITIIKGNIFDSKCQTIVNTVNCVGVMGKGIALQYKNKYPEMFQEYKQACINKELSIGHSWLYKSDSKWILNFPTKNHWRYPSKLEYIEQGLQDFLNTYKEKEITSIAFPLLGVGCGGLNSELVLNLMKSSLSKCDIFVEIYIY